MTSLNDFKNMYWSIIEKNKILEKEIIIKDNMLERLHDTIEQLNKEIYNLKINMIDNTEIIELQKKLDIYEKKVLYGTIKTIIEHNNSKYLSNLSAIRQVYRSYSYINLPNSNFFESSGSYLNAQGQFNHVIKSVRCGNLVKEDWQIFNKILKYSLKISFLNPSFTVFLVKIIIFLLCFFTYSLKLSAIKIDEHDLPTPTP